MLAVDRSASGHRRYTDGDLEWILLITRLAARACRSATYGRYADLVRSGPGNEAARLRSCRRAPRPGAGRARRGHATTCGRSTTRSGSTRARGSGLTSSAARQRFGQTVDLQRARRRSVDDMTLRTTTSSEPASPLTVSTLGLGCMGMSEFYGTTDEADGIATIRRALDLGRHLPRHRRHVRPVHQRAAASARRSRVAATRCSSRPSSATSDTPTARGSASTATPTTCAPPATPPWSGSASTTSTSTTSTAWTRRCRSRRPSARWPSSSRPARCATSGCPRRRRDHPAGPRDAPDHRAADGVLAVHPRPRGRRSSRRARRARHRAGALLAARARDAHRGGQQGLGAQGTATSRRSACFPRFEGAALEANLALVRPGRGARARQGRHARPARAGVGAGPGPARTRRRADPRHEAGDVPRGERRRRRRSRSPTTTSPPSTPRCPRDAVAGARYGDMSRTRSAHRLESSTRSLAARQRQPSRSHEGALGCGDAHPVRAGRRGRHPSRRADRRRAARHRPGAGLGLAARRRRARRGDRRDRHDRPARLLRGRGRRPLRQDPQRPVRATATCWSSSAARTTTRARASPPSCTASAPPRRRAAGRSC